MKNKKQIKQNKIAGKINLKHKEQNAQKRQAQKPKKKQKLNEGHETKKSKKQITIQQIQSQSQERSEGIINFNAERKQAEDGDSEQISNIDVSFVIAQLNEAHYHSLKTVLHRFSMIVAMNSSEIAGLLLQNKQIGNVSVADNEDEDDEGEAQENQDEQADQENIACSVVSILFSDTKAAKKLKNIVAKSSETHCKKSFPEIKGVLQKGDFSFLINQRIANMPAFIAQSSHKVFADDLKQLMKTNKKIGQYFIGISQIEKENPNDKNLEQLFFMKFEEFQFAKRSLAWWVGDSAPSKSVKADLRRFFYIIKVSDYFQGVKQLTKYVQESQK